MRRVLVPLSVITVWSVPVFAQESPLRLSTPAHLSFSPTERSAQTQADRGGFTVLVNMGLGFQTTSFVGLSESGTGLGGVNLGLGGFINPKLAILGRFSSTNVSYDFDFEDSFRQISGVFGATVQYWTSDRFIVEAGGGIGYWADDADESATGFGLILGASGVVFNRGRHNLLVGVEYAPAFTTYFDESFTVHNIGITFGYQFHAR